MNHAEHPELFFAMSGKIDTLAGANGYNRRLISELSALGYRIKILGISTQFPNPDQAAVIDAHVQFASVPDDAVLIIDGLAFAVFSDVAREHAQRLHLIPICHHPLALESGVAPETAAQLLISEKKALSSARAILVTSNMTAILIAHKLGIAPHKITVVPPGTDKHDFSPCAGSPPVLLTVATLTQRKAHDVLIDALAHIKHLPWSARFIGGLEIDPEWTTYLQSKVAFYTLENRISFVGNLENTSREYASADVFVLPSLFEGYGMAFAEALSFGLPIVAARAGSVPDVVPESAGILVPPANSLALAQALSTVLTDSAKRQQLRLGSQLAARCLPTWVDAAQTISRLIYKIGNY